MLDLKALLERLKGSNQKDIVGIGLTLEGLAYAHLTREGDELVLSHCDFLLNDNGEVPASQLKTALQAIGVQGAPCYVVLPPKRYDLLMIEAPKVPDEELREASRWKVKDLLSYPVEEAIIDVFPLPPESTKGRNMVYAVACREDYIRSIMALVSDVGLNLMAIETLELALRNVTELTPADNRGVGVVYMKTNRALFILMKGSQVYLSRQFDVSYNAGLFDELPEEQLTLELQRSLDYFERQMGQAPPGKILFCGENVSQDKLTPALTAAFAGEMTTLDLSRYAQASGQEESLVNLCIPALGAALKQAVQ